MFRDRHAPMPNLQRLRSWLPAGDALTADEWRTRHRVIVSVAAAHVPVLVVLALLVGEPLPHVLPGLSLILFSVAAAWRSAWSRRSRTLASTFALVTCSTVLVHLSGGLIEAHFHFFIVVTIVLLYQDWAVFGLAFAYVVLHHMLLSALAPELVFNHEAARSSPVLWSAVHGASMLAISVAGLVAWRFTERERDRAEAYADELSDALAAKDHLLATVSHDLRSPLVVIEGYSELLGEVDETTDVADIRQMADIMRRNGKQLADLIDDILTAAALRAGGIEPEPETVSLPELIDDVLVTLDIEADDSGVGSETSVHADPRHLRRILTNLLTNAWKYGRPPVRVSSVATDERVEIRIIDRGDGVPHSFVEQLFEPFSQAGPQEPGARGGVGLGLTVVRDLSRLNGGGVRYATTADGTVFTVTLPAGHAAGGGRRDEDVRPSMTTHEARR